MLPDFWRGLVSDSKKCRLRLCCSRDDSEDVGSASPNVAISAKINGLSVIFTSRASTIAGCRIKHTYWDFGDGTGLHKGQIKTHSYQASGDYVVTLSVEDSCGNIGKTEETLNV